MKKTYMIPEMTVIQRRTACLLAASATEIKAFITEYDGEQYAPEMDIDW